ncbi:MAG: hypothetical protein V7720_06420 [Halioglobus sp.]
MKLSELNDYIQTIAALGAIIALVAVGFQIQQSNRIATQEAVSNNWSNWIQTSVGLIESGISATRAKSMSNPDDLTLEEKIDLDEYLTVRISLYEHDYNVLSLDDRSRRAVWILEELEEQATVIFGSRFDRAWLEKNSFWMDTEVFDAIQRGLEDAPLGSDLEYYREIDALAATL